MFSSPALLVLLTAVFAGTGLYSLVRLSALASGAVTGGDRVAELSHLLMSVAMLGMTWGRTGGPDTAGGVLQLVVFGLLSAWFLVHVLRPHGHRRVAAAYHAVVQVAMVWMVAAMPALMGMGGAAPASGGHHHEGRAAAGGTAAPAGPTIATDAPPWMRLVTVAFVVLLAGAALAWATAAARPARIAVAVAPGGQPVPRPEPARPPGTRLDAACHVLMSLGMAAMLLAML